MRRNSESFTFTGQPLNRTADGPLSSATPSRATTRGLSKKGFSNKLLYPGFRKDGIDYHLNDCVLVEAEDQDEPYKAMIIACYRDEEGTGKMDIRWIYAASEVERQLGTTAARTRKCRALELDPAEIVHTDMKEVKEDIEHICGKIEVLSRDEYRSRYPKSNPDGIYFCHRTLGSARDVKAWPMDWEAFRRNEDAPPFEKAEAMQKREGKAKEHAAARTPARTTRNETAAATPASAKPNSVRKATGRRKKEGWTEEEVGQAAPPRKSRGRSSVEESEEQHPASEEAEQIDGEEAEDASEAEVATPIKKRKRKEVTYTPNKAATPSNRRMPLESLEQCTPTPRITARNASAVSASGKRATPSKRKPKLAPTPLPERALERSKARSVFERAREKLHMSVYPDALPCREDEYAQIYSELTSAIEEGSGGCVYISGVPGTGKTATVHAVMRALDKAVEDEELSPYRFVEINGMKLTEPAQAYSVLWEALTGKKVSSTHALSLLQKHFTTPSPNRQPTVLLMDEIDLLVTKNHSIMYNFLTWPDLQHARLIVVAIANTMDLPERMMINKVSSRLGLTRINFPAYTHQQLIEIVQSRLEGVQCFEKDAVELCARKIGAVSGDARRALDICRRGVEILEAKLESAAEAGTQDNKLVTMMVIDQAVKEMFASVAVQSVGRGSTHQRVFLVALVRSVRRAGIGEVEYGPVSDEHYRLCDMGNLPAPTAYDLYGICAQLHTSRLILLEQHRAGDRSQKLQLNISEEDVVTAVQNGGEAWLKRQVQSQ